MSKIDDLWAQANANPGTPIDIGELVVCDWCDEDWTTRTEPGGFILQSKAVCPVCAPSVDALVTKYGEQHFRRARCPEDQAFADFVRTYRGDNNKISVGPLRGFAGWDTDDSDREEP
ncbi:MAG TPA: hypothetical protein VK524_20325 [Polyangiaceae bacterium]|nr:hypothetical protein [Polyangiaceae bacterium]